MRLLLAAVVLLILPGCDSLPGKPTPEDRPLRPSEVKSFDVLYASNCAGCHGAEGTLGPALPLAHPLYYAFASDADLRRVTTSGVAGTAMPPFARSAGGTLTDAQIEILVAGMRERWGKGATLAQGEALPPYASDGGGDATRGNAVFERACARCHGATGVGGNVRGSIVDASYLALVSDQWLRTLVVVGRPDLRHPDWRGYEGSPLSAQDVTDVVAWLASQRTTFPGQPYAQTP